MHKKCLLLSGVFFWSSIQISFAQIVFSKLNTIYEEKFDSLGTSKTANLPIGFEVQSSKGNFSQTTEFAGTTGLNAFSAISSFGVYNCGHGVNSTATDRALGFITSSNVSSPSAYELICSFTNNTGATVDILDLWFDYEKYREGTRDWSLSLFHGDNPLSISNAATQGDQYFIADAGNTAVNPPLTFTKHVVISGLSIANGTDYYLKWVYQGVGGATNAQAIAIDNVHLTLKNEALIFRTKKSGSWHDTAIWEFSPTSSINWVNATLLPSHFLDSVIIQSGHHVQIEHAADLDRILVQSGGTLSFSQCNITVFDAANRNLVVENNAKLIYNGDATVLTKLSSVVFIHSQAVLQTNHKNGVDIFGNVNFETPFEQYLIFNAAQSQRTGSIPTVCKTLEIDTDSLLYLEDDLTISGTLKLNQGVIITDTFKLCLGTSTANKGSLSYTSGSIKGTFVRWFDGTNSGSSSGLFPLESNNNKKFVTVEFSSAPSAGGTLTASYINSSMGVSGLPVAVPAVGLCAAYNISNAAPSFWQIDDGNGLSGGTYEIAFEAEGFDGITDLCELGLLKRSGMGSWALAGTPVQTSGTLLKPIVKVTGASGWSNFGFGGGSLNILPISLTYFQAIPNHKQFYVTLMWETASEINNEHFEIQRSNNLIDWECIALQKGVGNSHELLQYSFVDFTPKTGVNYYRLIQVDKHGVKNSSKVIEAIIAPPNHQAEISIFPNPTDGHLVINTQSNEPFSITITTAAGKSVYLNEMIPQSNFSTYKLDLSVFPAGVYYLIIKVYDKITIKKVIKM